jgi:hypothetical protein
MIPASVARELQNHLSELYSLAVRDCAYANELVRESAGQPDLFEVAMRRAEEANVNCEVARQALMKHREEHRC